MTRITHSAAVPVLPKGKWEGRRTLGEVFARGAAEHPHTTITWDDPNGPITVSTNHLFQNALRAAGGFRRMGLQQGDVIAVQSPNLPEVAVVTIAASLAGLTIMPIVPTFGSVDVRYMLAESGAKALFVPAQWKKIDFATHVAEVGDSPSLESVVTLTVDTFDGAIPWHELAGGESWDGTACAATDVAEIIFSSGTTSNPKGILHSHKTLLAEALCDEYYPGASYDVPLFAYGGGVAAGLIRLIRTFAEGESYLLLQEWNAERAIEMIDRFSVTSTSGTPFFMRQLLDLCTKDSGGGESLRRLKIGGAGVTPDLIRELDDHGWLASRAYGLSEHVTVTSSPTYAPLAIRAETDGFALPGNSVRILDDDGRPLPSGQEGEVATKGPERFIGYHDATLNEEAFTSDGWFRTGDVGTLDGHGCLTITDRKKDIIIRGGLNLSSTEIEGVLLRLSNIAQAAVVAMPDPTYGERVCAFIVPDGAPPSLDDIARHFSELGMTRHKTPEALRIVASLPRSASGKVLKRELRQTFGDVETGGLTK